MYNAEDRVSNLVEQIERNQLQKDADGSIMLTGGRGHFAFTYEAYVDDSGGLETVIAERIEPIHKAFAADLLYIGVVLELTYEWEVNTEGQYPVFQFATSIPNDYSIAQAALALWHDGVQVCGKVDYGVELGWDGWQINDYTGIKTQEPAEEKCIEELYDIAVERADRWETECAQRVAELEELHARIRKIKSCPRYRLGESSLGPPMFAHNRGEWIKHEDMRNAAALAVSDDQKARHELLDADREIRKDNESNEPQIQTPLHPDIMFMGEEETTG